MSGEICPEMELHTREYSNLIFHVSKLEINSYKALNQPR